ncbi:RDD family protein [Hymenobacter chitinivorans]|uniref:Putative RDD family membrane protein YckC n=1 Tax=Hymenobacter chitinivorans DSM 11115 TaxID=1121954 RepID=A0A2M9AQL7_9BACT|nr:RDD family protein [Hymenobacter chitinivorans]PJJ47997.1 putative RDD family membrane protein YckC [Hymenobacter chitinivorans DSM 11115]
MQQDYLDQDYTDDRVENPSVFADLLDSPLALTLATSGQRFANSVIDTIAFYMLFFALAVVLGILSAVIGNAAIVDSLDGPLGTLLSLGVLFAYYFGMELLTGRTLGKLITRTRVVMEDGTKPTASAIAKRTLCRMIPFEAFSFLTDGPGMHDRLSNTRVVKTN